MLALPGEGLTSVGSSVTCVTMPPSPVSFSVSSATVLS